MWKYWFLLIFQITVRSQRPSSTPLSTSLALQQSAIPINVDQSAPFLGSQWQNGLQFQQSGQSNQCYWTGIFPNCQSGCQRRDIVALDLARPVGSLCQTGRLRYCCSSRGWNRDRHRPNHDFEDNRRPGQWNDWNNGPRPIFGLDLNIG